MIVRMGICDFAGYGDKFRVWPGIPVASLSRTHGELRNSVAVLERDESDGTRSVGTPAEGDGNEYIDCATVYRDNGHYN